MRIKSLAQGENILMLRFEPATFVSKIDILTTTPIVHNSSNNNHHEDDDDDDDDCNDDDDNNDYITIYANCNNSKNNIRRYCLKITGMIMKI